MLGKTKTAPTVRSLSEISTAYAAAKALHARVKGQLGALDREENDLHTRLASFAPAPQVNRRVAEILGDEPPATDHVNAGAANERLAAIAAERIDLRAAVEEARKREVAARYEASKTACADLKPEYRKRVGAVATAFLAAHKAAQELEAFAEQMTAAEIVWVSDMPPVPPERAIGYRGNRLATWFREAIGEGLIKAADVPEELRG